MRFRNPVKKVLLHLVAVAIIAPITYVNCNKVKNREAQLKKDVNMIASVIGTRCPQKHANLEKTVSYIHSRLDHLLPHSEEKYYLNGKPYRNLIFENTGKKRYLSAIIIGAHYDSTPTTPGADDNASAVAVLLSIAESLPQLTRTVRYVFFTLEEAPYAFSEDMGSMRYARYLRDNNEQIEIMICLEMVGYYSNEPIQEYPIWSLYSLYPAEANFAAVVANEKNRRIATQWYNALKKNSGFRMKLIVAPVSMRGIDFSDHSSFWKLGFPALMITDTAFYRNSNYHQKTDTPDTLDYHKMSLLVHSLSRALYNIDSN